jgi:hypothetical protein
LTKGDLYLAHFLGSGGASRLLKLVEDNPEGNAAKAFPAAAKANRSVFMKWSAPLSVDSVMLRF